MVALYQFRPTVWPAHRQCYDRLCMCELSCAFKGGARVLIDCVEYHTLSIWQADSMPQLLLAPKRLDAITVELAESDSSRHAHHHAAF